MSFETLSPSLILNALEDQGYNPTGQISPYNSYENRVYEITLPENESIIAKFYRPNRWSAQQIAEEHQFLGLLDEAEVPVVNSFALTKPQDIHSHLGFHNGFYFSLFPKFKGYNNPDLSNDDRRWLGRTLARMHNVGESFDCEYRILLDVDSYGYDYLDTIMRLDSLPDDLANNLEDLMINCLKLIEPHLNESVHVIPLHGDCHLGNVLWNDKGPHLLDFDDMVLAPPVQDVWMLFHGSEEEKAKQQDSFLEGYSLFRDFEEQTFLLAEPLRTLRMIRHAGWIATRCHEEIFKRTFPDFGTRKYWEDLILELKEQLGLLQELEFSQ